MWLFWFQLYVLQLKILEGGLRRNYVRGEIECVASIWGFFYGECEEIVIFGFWLEILGWKWIAAGGDVSILSVYIYKILRVLIMVLVKLFIKLIGKTPIYLTVSPIKKVFKSLGLVSFWLVLKIWVAMDFDGDLWSKFNYSNGVILLFFLCLFSQTMLFILDSYTERGSGERVLVRSVLLFLYVTAIVSHLARFFRFCYLYCPNFF